MPELITERQSGCAKNDNALKLNRSGEKPDRDKTDKSEWRSIGCIAAFFLILTVIISPQGNFPTNDDWVYGFSVKQLLETGQFQLAGCCAASITHVLLGAAVCWLTGFSFEPLRLLTIMLGFAGTVVVYLIARQMGVTRSASLLASLVYAANPLVVNTTFSFMTDITSATLTLCYMYFLLRGFRSNHLRYYVIAAAFLSFSVMTRQLAAVFIVLNLAVLLLSKQEPRRFLCLTLLLLIIPSMAFVFSEKFILAVDLFPENALWYHDLISSHITAFKANPAAFLFSMVVQLGKVACYFGMFLAPLLVLFVPLWRSMRSRNALIFCGISFSIMLVSIWYALSHHQTMPFLENLLRIPGLGCFSIMGINHDPLSRTGRKILTWVALALGAALLAVTLHSMWILALIAKRAVRQIHRNRTVTVAVTRRRLSALFLCSAALCVSIAVILLQTSVFGVDRYLITALPWFVLCLTASVRILKVRTFMPLSVVLLLGMTLFSLAAQQDYMGWNRARWRLIDGLLSKGVHHSRIDGGAEFNQYMQPSISRVHVDSSGTRISEYKGEKPRCDWRWWPISGEEYIVSFSTIPDYDLVETRKYFSLLSLSEKSVLLLRKAAPKAP